MTTKFIVTGGAGLIGANLVAALNQRGEKAILIVDSLNHPDKEANLRRIEYESFMDKDEFRAKVRGGQATAPQTLFHLGACSSTTETRLDYLASNNTEYTRELCEWSLANDMRFIYASSAATYGDGEKGYDDSDSVTPGLQPLNPYGWSKQYFDLWALERGYLSKIVGLKYFNVFGAGEDHKGEMRSLVHKAYAQIQETGVLRLFRSLLPQYRDGEQTRDFVSVADAVKTTLFFHDNPEIGGLFNCGTGRARTWLDLAHALFAAMRKAPEIEFVDMPEKLRDKYQYHTQAKTGKLASTGAPVPATSLEESVERYVRLWLSLPTAERSLRVFHGDDN